MFPREQLEVLTPLMVSVVPLPDPLSTCLQERVDPSRRRASEASTWSRDPVASHERASWTVGADCHRLVRGAHLGLRAEEAHLDHIRLGARDYLRSR